MLANYALHKRFPFVLTIAEEVCLIILLLSQLLMLIFRSVVCQLFVDQLKKADKASTIDWLW